ncbi:hypothetical protein HK097_007861, partial [Rhizophlyctis rosea]
LKQRLLTKEAKAQQRREREISKLQAKLAKQEDHARRVQERKRMLGKMSNEDLRLSWGGEKELPGIETIEIEREQMNGNNRNFDEDFPVGMTRPSTAVGGTNGPFDADSEHVRGSSSASLNTGSRGGSGRSVGEGKEAEGGRVIPVVGLAR